MRNIEKLMRLFVNLEKEGFTGFIRINYNQGGVTKVEKTEEILKKLKQS
jgi:hypothetical protein